MSFRTYFTEKVPIEKIYTQTDRPFYFPEETIWFKSYIVANDNTISGVSDIMIAKLISPKGATLKTIKLSVEDGYAYGDFHVNKNWVGGIYTLKTYTNWMRNFGDEATFTKKINIQKIVKPNVLLNLKFEKEGYGQSSEVTANFEAKNLKNKPLKHKDITFEVSAKGKKIISKTIVTNDDGKATPTFKLPKDLSTTDVVLNVLLPYNGTTESISRSVPVVLDNIDLQFFPESGKLIANTKNRVAFKALNEFGKPVDVSGDIVDNNGNVISTFNSFHDGMGAFTISTENNNTFYAKIKTPFVSERKITLPKIHQNGTRFSVISDSLNTKLKLFSTENIRLQIKVSNASKLLFSKRINSSRKVINIDTRNFPIGISKFSILDINGNIVAERLVFLNAHKQLKVDIQLDKSVYKTREKVKASITTTDFKGTPIPSNLSVAISDNKLLSFADDKQDHILSYLLVSSELKGRIHKPSFYFNPKEPKSYKALDYLMLTHGWRDYIHTPNLTYENANFKPEKRGLHSGVVVDKKGNPVKANLLLFNTDGYNVLPFKTSDKGEFQFKSVALATLTLVAYTDDGKPLKIIKDKFKKGTMYDDKNAASRANSTESKAFLKNDKPLQTKIKQEVTANIALTEDVDALDEVVVIGYGTMKKSSVTGAVAQVVSEEISIDSDLARTLQGRVSGVTISEGFLPGNNSKVIIRGAASFSGNSNPLVVVDGVVQDINDIDLNNIKNLSVLKDAAATAVYGSRGANGVIIITTKNNSFYNYGKKKLNNAKYNNYTATNFYDYNGPKTYRSKLFYVPKYDSKTLPEERTDFRQTIYWNPVVQTDEHGKAEFEFYNSDAITSFKVTAEGVGFDGLVGRKETLYATNKLLNIDFKAPNYMALNDTVVLPISVTNETDRPITANLKLLLPEHLKLLKPFESEMVLKAKHTAIKNISVIPIKKGENATIQVSLKSDEATDIVKRNVTILSPYFPTELSISGSKSQSFNFDINHVVQHSLKAEFNIYTDVIGDVMDGIEGLIRQPYGCFEQTSSSTYPNIMVLKYLKEAGKSNPEIEAKAMGFIKKGYKRLISFETKEGGFEWFGHTPPHETLTAYGILEFTEMKEVYTGVDQNMIDRTVKWLLSRKDGKGGFQKSKKGYDSFASSPIDVANAYIVYALSESKINEDFRLEYNTAYKDALKSNDTYKMALLALASYNLNQIENAETLIKRIKQNIKTHDFQDLPVANTITRSYGNAKNIETVAFTLLALMRDNTNNDALISKGIKHIVGKREYNRFGSTQSTAMALKALIAYTKREKQKIITSKDVVELVIKGNILHEKLNLSENGKITIPNITDYITDGNQTLTVKFNNPKTTFPYALNVMWDSSLPDTSGECPLKLETVITEASYNVGDNVSMTVNVSNKKVEKLGMVTAIIGIPSGATPQPWQLKEILEQNKVAYYEIFDNYLVFYWREFDASETKTIRLDLKADIAGRYKAPASTAYLYYGDEFKTWISGNTLEIKN
ncbi:hypothetical protein GCM10011368_16720 [Hyunsoonleella pacifica]|nr:hypothetical protein GCM10011368_16720 [Hyunsoonleella pacifica]